MKFIVQNVNMKQKFPKNESEWINKEDLTSLWNDWLFDAMTKLLIIQI